jgi:hypothetical protein
LTNTLAIAVIHALERIPSLRECDPEKVVHFPCNSEYDFKLIVDMYDYCLNDEEIIHTPLIGETEAFYFFPNDGIIHLFVKEG